MNAASLTRKFVRPWSDGRGRGLPEREVQAAYWRINGHRARLLIWSPAEWEQMATRPLDAQFHPAGVWCALRIE
jgi:hypothetical protein